jgi:hypothetical protein
VPTLDTIPPPRRSGTLYEVDGVARTLTEWSQASGIPKPTLLYRVTTAGRVMADALAMGRAKHRERRPRTQPEAASEAVEDGSTAPETAAKLRQSLVPQASADSPRIPEEPLDKEDNDCRTGAAVSVEAAGISGYSMAPLAVDEASDGPKSP